MKNKTQSEQIIDLLLRNPCGLTGVQIVKATGFKSTYSVLHRLKSTGIIWWYDWDVDRRHTIYNHIFWMY